MALAAPRLDLIGDSNILLENGPNPGDPGELPGWGDRTGDRTGDHSTDGSSTSSTFRMNHGWKYESLAKVPIFNCTIHHYSSLCTCVKHHFVNHTLNMEDQPWNCLLGCWCPKSSRILKGPTGLRNQRHDQATPEITIRSWSSTRVFANCPAELSSSLVGCSAGPSTVYAHPVSQVQGWSHCQL